MKEAPLLWTPNNDYSLDAEYPAMSEDELAHAWASYANVAPEILDSAPGFLGMTHPPETTPDIVVSVDLCEVLRETHATLRTVEEPYGTPFRVEPYGNNTKSLKTIPDILSVAQVMIDHDLIRPTPDIHRMAAYLKTWRLMGAYVVANTSTLEGCEAGTVRFLNTHTPEGFDGILFPRNYDGLGSITKGLALRTAIVDRYTDTNRPLHIIHIDDATRHLVALPKAFEDLQNATVTTFQPIYPAVQPHEDSIHGDTPVDSFAKVHQYITDLTLSRAS